MSDFKTLGEFIRETRNAQGLSLRELARRAGIAPAFLSELERGKRNPSSHVLAKIASVLETDLEQLQNLDSNAALAKFKELLEKHYDLRLAFIGMLMDLKDGVITIDGVIKSFKVKRCRASAAVEG